MAVQSTIDNLKDKPHDEKRAVAGGVAVGVVVILLVGWAFMFLRGIQRGDQIPTLQGSSVPEDQLNAQFIQASQQQMNQYYQQSDDRYRDLRDTGSGESTVDVSVGVSPSGESGGFGASQSDF